MKQLLVCITLKFCFILFLVSGSPLLIFAGDGSSATHDTIILFKATPNPASNKCMIRVYLPDSDPYSSLRILDKDSTLVKEVPLAGEVGTSSRLLNVTDWKAGIYYYQLFFKGETRSTLSLQVTH